MQFSVTFNSHLYFVTYDKILARKWNVVNFVFKNNSCYGTWEVVARSVYAFLCMNNNV